MHSLLDDYAHANALRDVSPRVKLLLGLGSVLICISSTSPLAPACMAIALSLVTVFMARIPARVYSRLLLLPLSFALLSVAVVAFMHGKDEPIFSANIFGLNLGITGEGADLALLLLARTFGSMCALFFLGLTTPMIEIFSVLRSLKLPEVMIELSMMIYRYIFVFLDQAATIHSAQVMRLGDASFRSSLNSLAMLASILFIRAWEQGERLTVAMDARCYNGHLEVMESEATLTSRSLLATFLYLAAAGALAYLTRDLRLI